MRLPALCAAALAATAWSCGDDGGSGDDQPADDAAVHDAPPGTPDASPVTCTPVQGTPALGVETVVDGLDMPVFVTSPPNDPRLFILEKTGFVRIVEDGLLLPQPFLDVNSVNVTSLSDERGLLGLAFHPDFAQNRKLYVFYMSSAGEHVVEQWLADAANPNVAEAGSGQTVLTLDDFAGNHNGGMIAFGPNDGHLYIGIGDGGNANDPNDYGEDTTVWFGKLLRIDVDQLPYTIPAGNPLADGAGGDADEIWAYGLRNPWRWSFDRQTGDLYIGDVGQGSREEVDVQPASSTGGVNYGWDTMEGLRCFEPATGCDMTGRTLPVYEYTHAEGCTVIGGYVYRGCRMPGYHGTYFFGEYCGGWTRSFRWDGAGGFTDEQEWAGLSNLGDIVSYGEDAAGELYIVLQDSPDGGKVVRIVPQ